MAKRGEIEINVALCRGCSICVKYCPNDCIVQPEDKLTGAGQIMATFVNKDKCNACGICGWMCPEFAIEVYQLTEAVA